MILSRKVATTTFFSISLIVPAIAFLAIAILEEKLFSFSNTLSWTPGSIKECNTVEDVVAAVQEASFTGTRIKGLGTGWSWSTTIAGDGDTYIRLTGPLANATLSDFNLTDPGAATVTVGGGVRAFQLYMELQKTGFNIEAKGACIRADESQTIGGLLATNVHHSGIKTFYDIVEWVDVVTATGLVRTYRDETLFRLTIGGGGRTGIIARIQLNLAPRATYEDVDVSQPSDTSYKTFLQEFVDLTSGYEPNEFIALGVRFPVIGPSYRAKQRMSVPSTNPAVLPPNFGKLSPAAEAALRADDLVDSTLTPFLYTVYYAPLLSSVLLGVQPDRNGKSGEDLDVASSSSSITHLKHQEIEFFVPTEIAGDVGTFLDEKFASGTYPFVRDHGLFALRFVYGSNSLTAANGVLADGSMPDVVAVNIDCFQRSQWSRFNGELNDLMADLSKAFPQQIRTHPGKYNPPVSPDPESQMVKDMIASFDPNGLFARDAYDETYLQNLPE